MVGCLCCGKRIVSNCGVCAPCDQKQRRMVKAGKVKSMEVFVEQGTRAAPMSTMQRFKRFAR